MLKSFISLFFCYSFILILGVSCENAKGKDYTTEEAVLKREINARLKELDSLSEKLKQNGIDPQKIHKDIEQLLLVSKDSENLQASVNMSNNYFNTLSEEHLFNKSMLVHFSSEMNGKDISLALKQNELFILNQIALEKLDQKVELKSAH